MSWRSNASRTPVTCPRRRTAGACRRRPRFRRGPADPAESPSGRARRSSPAPRRAHRRSTDPATSGLAAFEVKDVRRAEMGRVPGPVEGSDRHPRGSPPDTAFLPRFDLVPGEGEAARLFDLLPPDSTLSTLRGVQPLLVVRPDREHARLLRDPRHHRVGVPLRVGDEPPVYHTPDLLRGFHARECGLTGD